MTDSQDERNEAREEEARTDALAASHDEGELDALPVDLEADSEGEPNAKPTDWEKAERPPTGPWAKPPEGEPEGTGYVDAEGQVDAKYQVAHVVDIEEDQTVSMCGEEIEGELQGDRVLGLHLLGLSAGDDGQAQRPGGRAARRPAPAQRGQVGPRHGGPRRTLHWVDGSGGTRVGDGCPRDAAPDPVGAALMLMS